MLKHDLPHSSADPGRPSLFAVGEPKLKSKLKTFSSIQDKAGLFDEMNQKFSSSDLKATPKDQRGAGFFNFGTAKASPSGKENASPLPHFSCGSSKGLESNDKNEH